MTQRVLLIIDEASVAKAIVDALSHSTDESFQVEWVRRCSEGLERLNGIAALLVDLYLPDSRGIETFKRISGVARDIPIMVLTSPQDENTARLAVQCGAQDYFLKARVEAYPLRKAVAAMIERAAIAAALFEERERAQVTLNSIGDAVMSTNVSGEVTYLNVIAERLTGWSQEEAVGLPVEDIFRIVDARTREIAQNPMILSMRENKIVALTPHCVLIRRDGREADVEDSSAPIHDRTGAVTGAVMVFHDVSVARAMTVKMAYLAQHDRLTDLPNGVLMNDRLVEAIALSSRYERKLALLFLDLDRFKFINDSLGHVVGDGLLRSVARRLFTCVRSSDTVSRRGGDEFVILLWEVRQPQDAAATAEKILQALREVHHVDGHELQITGSIGIVTYPDDGADAETLLKNADFAMYDAKDSGRDTYQFFKTDMNERAIVRRALEGELRHAIERQQLVLNYQPKIDLVTGEIIGVEALVRWHHSEGRIVPPIQFIPIAEECGLIVPIGRWVLREACNQVRAWQAAGLPTIYLAVNISAVELRAVGFVAGVRTILTESGLDPRLLELELTETFLMVDARSTAEVLRELKEIGVTLALDDFGTGYSSLSYLKRFPLDTLKIDRSFVRNITTDADDASIVSAVIGLGRNLHMRVVAEGVETREQLEFLREHACPVGQGFYFSVPLPAAEFAQLLEREISDMTAA